MNPDPIDDWLVRSFEDRHLSRGERQALSEIAATADRQAIRQRAFGIARDALAQPADRAILEWLEDVVKATREDAPDPARLPYAEAYFSPGEECVSAIRRLLANTRRAADICVFTITDDRLADAVLDAHRRRVAVRVITDDAKSEDLGSDVERFERAGIPVRVDRSEFHMHHKFAIIDGGILLTGSYNWTRGAARDNEENLIVTDEPKLISRFVTAFERLWDRLA